METEVDEELQKRAEKNARDLIAHLRALTLNLVRFDDPEKPTEPEGLASGFLWSHEGKPYLLTAGHSLDKGPWFWEPVIDLTEHRKTLAFPVGPFMRYKAVTVGTEGDVKFLDAPEDRLPRVDFGWCEFPVARYAEQMRSDPILASKDIRLNPYTQPFDRDPVAGEPYTFAATSKGKLEQMGILFLHRDTAYDFLEFVGTNEKGHHVFKPLSGHKGSDYYKGASGSPIAAPDGAIVSMLIGGHPDKNEIYGFALTRMQNQVGFDPTLEAI